MGKRILVSMVTLLSTLFCGGIGIPPEPMGVGVVQGTSTTFNRNSVSIPLVLRWNQSKDNVNAVIDTGSFTTIIPPDVATRLNLPYHGDCYVTGVNGERTKGYYSSVYIKVDKKEYGVPCVVLPSFQYILLGADFFKLCNLDLEINFTNDKVNIKPAH